MSDFVSILDLIENIDGVGIDRKIINTGDDLIPYINEYKVHIKGDLSDIIHQHIAHPCADTNGELTGFNIIGKNGNSFIRYDAVDNIDID